jgi:hypothetical protein
MDSVLLVIVVLVAEEQTVHKRVLFATHIIVLRLAVQAVMLAKRVVNVRLVEQDVLTSMSVMSVVDARDVASAPEKRVKQSEHFVVVMVRLG